ncbi:response regulator [Candidatus Uabimicrobium sp. HlEnr_7]|uniref:response regulator n=1 Tax=Candidatus Uabimicrobium helgolandensis TaxID=3095367 RepID=UPI00355848D8
MNRKVLIVEDNKDNSQLVEKILKFYGYQTQILENGEDAIEWCKNNNADMILMDIHLPQKSGLETTSEVRKMDTYRTIPIIALTAHAMKGWKDKCLQAGCTDYITKPFRPQTLIECMNSHFEPKLNN